MGNVIIEGVRTYNGIHVPLSYVRGDAPDPRRPHGYHRIMEQVERNATSWVEFDFGHRRLAQQVAQRLRRHTLGHRYEVIWAHDLVFIRAKHNDVKALMGGE